MRPTLVIAPGAFVTDAEFWYRPLAEHLEPHGVPVRPVNLPSCGYDSPLGDLFDDAEAMGKVVDEIGGPVILGGHSYSALVATQASKGRKRKVRHLLYISGVVGDKCIRRTGCLRPPPASRSIPTTSRPGCWRRHVRRLVSRGPASTRSGTRSPRAYSPRAGTSCRSSVGSATTHRASRSTPTCTSLTGTSELRSSRLGRPPHRTGVSPLADQAAGPASGLIARRNLGSSFQLNSSITLTSSDCRYSRITGSTRCWTR
jgi:pimeloyl-ACP methyl ester carboxylesterase